MTQEIRYKKAYLYYIERNFLLRINSCPFFLKQFDSFIAQSDI